MGTEDDRQREGQAFVRNQRRRRGHGIGALQHGKRRLIEFGITRPLNDRARNDVAGPVDLEADLILTLTSERSAG